MRRLIFNGRERTGRLLLNWQFLQAGFPFTVIQVEERARYLGALEQGVAGRSAVIGSAVLLLK